MKIYDCFIFSNELEILRLRLDYLWDTVDYFVLVESGRTLSNQPKALTYQDHRALFEKYQSKIIHVIADTNDLPAWEYEYFQRNAIQNGLKSCKPDDIVFVSDVDEIINIKEIIRRLTPGTGARIEIPMFYYYLNLRTNIPWRFNIVAPYAAIQSLHIGDRTLYEKSFPAVLDNDSNKNGWHFSYLFGRQTSLYVAKVKSFSHQEFNTPYYLNPERIGACIDFGIDLFERAIPLVQDDAPLKELAPSIKSVGLEKYIYRSRGLFAAGPSSIYWLVRMKVFNRIKNAIRNRLMRS